MAYGQIAPDDRAWLVGAAALASSEQRSAPWPADPVLDALDDQLHALGRRAMSTTAPAERAEIRRALLTTCAACHARIR